MVSGEEERSQKKESRSQKSEDSNRVGHRPTLQDQCSASFQLVILFYSQAGMLELHFTIQPVFGEYGQIGKIDYIIIHYVA